MTRSRWVLGVVGLLVLGTFASCQCGGSPAAGPDAGEEVDAGGGGGGGAGGGGGSGGGGGGPGHEDGGCRVLGNLCENGAQCCSGFCNASGLCASSGGFCSEAGEACAENLDCCSNRCSGGKCSSIACADNGTTCGAGAECCTLNCAGGTCAAVPGSTFTCKVQGQACSAGSECCSTLCRNGACAPAYLCQANGDVCSKDSDCCGNACSVSDGGSGFCQFISGGASGGCLQDGNPCPSGGENCCSRTCVDLGSGAPVCAPATGCRVTGNFCAATSNCCGGAPNPNGTVTCDSSTSRCTLGIGCEPPGTICGNAKLPDGGTLAINASVDCCTGTNPPVDTQNLCKLDSSGIPRCYGGKSGTCPTGYTGERPCCIEPGNLCQFKDQCCDGNPCLPNPDGGAGFYCSKGSSCLGLGTACNPNVDGGSGCCAPTVCEPTSELSYACQHDTGTPDAGSCTPNYQTCSSAGECCSGICVSTDGGPRTCQPPGACQQEGDVCTASADCCSGLSCAIQAGSTTGSCEKSTCQNAGQGCSPSQACCTGLMCLSSTGTSCDGTTTCTCTVIIN